MREALARSDLDFTTSEAAPSRAGSEAVRLPKILRAACVSTAVVVGAVIVANALFMQDRKHPAPLLRAPDPAVMAEPVQTPRPAPRPIAATPASTSASTSASAVAPSAPVARSGRDTIADEINRAAPTERRAAKVAPSPKPDAEKADAIASLIGVATGPSAAVMAAQKALVKLGYVLRADGMAGATTKQAIERYERDNKLPVRGELTPKIAREVAAKSGVAMP